MLKSLFALIRHGIDLWNRLGKPEDRTSELTREQDRLNALIEQFARELDKLARQLEDVLLQSRSAPMNVNEFVYVD